MAFTGISVRRIFWNYGLRWRSGVGHGSEGVREGLEGCWKGVREVRIFMMPFLNRPDN